MKKRTFASLGVLIAICAVGRAAVYEYDFADHVSYSANYPGTSITDQDGWYRYAWGAAGSSLGAFEFTATDGVTRVSAYQNEPSGIYAQQASQYTRGNDANFAYEIGAGDTNVSLSMVIRGRDAYSSVFGLGYYDGGTFILGVQFGTTWDNKWDIRAADGTHTAVNHNLGDVNDYVRVVMDIDLTANGGEGSGSLSYENLTQGTALAPIAGMQDIGLSFSSVNSATTWDNIFLRTQKAGACMADLSITTSVIPEPATMLLLGLGGISVIIRKK